MIGAVVLFVEREKPFFSRRSVDDGCAFKPAVPCVGARNAYGRSHIRKVTGLVSAVANDL